MSTRLIALFIALASFFNSNGQGVPNGTFDNWTFNLATFQFEPNSWITTNFLVPVGQADSISVSQTIDKHLGNFAIRLENKEPAVAAGAFAGNLVIFPLNLTIGYQFSSQPIQVKGWCKYFPVGNDTGGVIINLLNDTGAVIASGAIAFGDTIPVYTEFTFDVEYDSTISCHKVDTVVLAFTTSLNNPVVGSVMFIDDLIFEMTPTNTGPVAVDDYQDLASSQVVMLDVLANDSDADGDNIEVTRIVNQPINGTVIIFSNDSIEYTPNVGFEGIDSFTYEITDRHGPSGCAIAQAVINIWLTGIDETEPFKPFSPLRPNPISDIAIFNYPTGSGLMQLNIYDVFGRIVQSYPYQNGQVKISTARMPMGSYYYVLSETAGQVIYRGKFLIVR